jgi:ArsR family transcriptional regulator
MGDGVGRVADRAACADAINECRFIDMDAAPLLRLLGDETRLRLLRLLGQEALNVSELTAVLGLAQSGVSRHLALLRDAGLVAEDRDGGYAWYRLADAASHNGQAPLWAWLREQFERATPQTRADDARLAEVRRVRKERFAEPRRQHHLEEGRSGAAATPIRLRRRGAPVTGAASRRASRPGAL